MTENQAPVGEGPEISVVVPLYNEEGNLGELLRRLGESLDELGREAEVILVDDGSADGTWEGLVRAARTDHRLRLVRLRRNFGQTAALAAGFDHARGRIVVAMDGDLQHSPEEIGLLVEKLDEGYDIASGWRKKRVDHALFRRLPSRIANRLIGRLSGLPLHDFGTTFKAYRREVLDGLELYGELHRFIPVLAAWRGVRIAEVPITNVERRAGESSYGLSRTRTVLFDMLTVKFLTHYLARPLQFFGTAGLAFFLVGFLAALVLTVLYYAEHILISENLGNLIFAMLCMVLGVQLVATGLALEVGVRTYHKTSGRKIYAVREVVEGGIKDRAPTPR